MPATDMRTSRSASRTSGVARASTGREAFPLRAEAFVEQTEPRFATAIERGEEAHVRGAVVGRRQPHEGEREHLDDGARRGSGVVLERRQHLEALVGEHRHPAGEHRPHERFLGAEVVVGGGDVAVGLGVDRPQRHAVDPTLADQLLGGVEQPLLDRLHGCRRRSSCRTTLVQSPD